MNLDAAEAYASRNGGEALVARRGDAIVLERYGPRFDGATPHALYSGTKSFWGPAAVAAEDDGLLALDEPVAATVPEWRDGARGAVTLRMLLQLTSGIGFGGLGSAVPAYAKALATPLKHEPGTTFTYGGIPLQVFGAVLARKLAPRGQTPHDFLRARILDPIGLRVASWRTLADGTSPLPTGAFVAAREWLKLGVLVRDDPRYARCFVGSAANPRYGLCWWLSPLPAHPDVVYASGAGGQALYVVPAEGAVVARFGNGAAYKHEAFLRRLLE